MTAVVLLTFRVTGSFEQLGHASLKEHLQTLLRDNQILKRAVAIQHERNSEQEVKTREVQQLKHVICQYQEQVRSLEVIFSDKAINIECLELYFLSTVHGLEKVKILRTTEYI